MRTTFGTGLSKAGVAPRTAQAAMRHSKIDLTMNVYTDPRLLDVAGAIAALPDLPLDIDQQLTREMDSSANESEFAPESDQMEHSETISDNIEFPDISSRNERILGKTGVFRGFLSEAEGTRTPNHRIDSPVL